jgi:hypothetical protein
VTRRRFHRTDHSQPDIVSTLRECGDYVAIIGRPVDLLIRSGQRYWTAECKTPGPDAKKRQPSQIGHADDALAHGAPHFVLQTPDDAIRIRNALVAGAKIA